MTRPVLCLYWELWTPKVLTTALMDAMNWCATTGNGAVTTFTVTFADQPDVLGEDDLRRALTSMGLPMDHESPVTTYLGYFVSTRAGLPQLPTGGKWDGGRRMVKDLTPRRHKMPMRPDDPRYPNLPDTTRPAPPMADPLSRPRPPRSAHNLFLPPWAML